LLLGKECPIIKCPIHCPFGSVTVNGCLTCKCKPGTLLVTMQKNMEANYIFFVYISTVLWVLSH